ncbi:MAG: hypothetical protein ACTSRI_20255 [Promethearchaeota archaeon]
MPASRRVFSPPLKAAVFTAGEDSPRLLIIIAFSDFFSWIYGLNLVK